MTPTSPIPSSTAPGTQVSSSEDVFSSLTPNAETREVFEKTDRDEDLIYYNSFEDFEKHYFSNK